MKNRFLVGVEYGKTDFSSARRFSNGTAGTHAALQAAAVKPVVGVFDDHPALTTGADYRTDSPGDATTTALFAEDALRLSNAFTLMAGLRTECKRLLAGRHLRQLGHQASGVQLARAQRHRLAERTAQFDGSAGMSAPANHQSARNRAEGGRKIGSHWPVPAHQFQAAASAHLEAVKADLP